MILKMDHWLAQYASIASRKFEKYRCFKAGNQAAGGCGFAFSTFLNGVLEPEHQKWFGDGRNRALYYVKGRCGGNR